MAKSKKPKRRANKKSNTDIGDSKQDSAENDKCIATLRLGFYAHSGYVDVGEVNQALLALRANIASNTFMALFAELQKIATSQEDNAHGDQPKNQEWWDSLFRPAVKASDEALVAYLNDCLRTSVGTPPSLSLVIEDSGGMLLYAEPKTSPLNSEPIKERFDVLRDYADAASQELKGYDPWYQLGTFLGTMYKTCLAINNFSSERRKKWFGEQVNCLKALVRGLPADERKQIEALQIVAMGRVSGADPEKSLLAMLEKLKTKARQRRPHYFEQSPIVSFMSVIAEELATIRAKPPKQPVQTKPMKELQKAIMKALDGKALTKDALAKKVCGGDGSRLYKARTIQELMEARLVVNKRGVGYYRPDAPPPDSILAKKTT